MLSYKKGKYYYLLMPFFKKKNNISGRYRPPTIRHLENFTFVVRNYGCSIEATLSFREGTVEDNILFRDNLLKGVYRYLDVRPGTSLIVKLDYENGQNSVVPEYDEFVGKNFEEVRIIQLIIGTRYWTLQKGFFEHLIDLRYFYGDISSQKFANPSKVAVVESEELNRELAVLNLELLRTSTSLVFRLMAENCTNLRYIDYTVNLKDQEANQVRKDNFSVEFIYLRILDYEQLDQIDFSFLQKFSNLKYVQLYELDDNFSKREEVIKTAFKDIHGVKIIYTITEFEESIDRLIKRYEPWSAFINNYVRVPEDRIIEIE